MTLTTAASGFLLVLLLSVEVMAQNHWGATYTPTRICALKGSTVNISCTYTYPSRTYYGEVKVKETFWFTGHPPVDLTTEPGYSDRVRHSCHERSCSLMITDLREDDQREYKLRVKTNQQYDYTASPGVTLFVADLQVKTRIRSYSGWVDLTCRSSSCDLPAHLFYVWYKNGEQIPGQTSSSYSDTHAYGDSYSCAVRGQEDFPSPPVCVSWTCHKVTYDARSICAAEGSSVDISCTYESLTYFTSKFWFSPERKHQWQSPSLPQYPVEGSWDEGRVQVEDAGKGHSTLKITDLRVNDSAEYRFKFTRQSFVWASVLPATTLTVTALQVQVTTVSVSGYYTEVKLKCHTSCRPADALSYVWFKNQQKISGQQTSSFQDWFHIGDNISCALKGHEGHGSAPVYAPKQPSVIHSGEMVEGRSLNLTCESDANPAANYTWYKDHQRYYPQPPSKEAQLVFSSILSSDSGKYSCAAENELGRTAPASMSVRVKYPPKSCTVSASPSGEVLEGRSVTLRCSSDDNPPANFTWYKQNQTQPLRHGDTFHFPSVSSEDRGSYYCKSENQYGHVDSSPVLIDVQYAPKLLSVSVSPSGDIVEGSSVTLTCSSDAHPAANYTWYKEEEDSPVASGQNFTISDVRAEHSGSYSCEAQNTRGRQSSVSHLLVMTGNSSSITPAPVRLAAAASITAVLLAVAFLAAFLLIRRRRCSKQTTERPDNKAQLNKGSSCKSSEEQEDQELCYSSVGVFKSQEDPLYDNLGPAQANRQANEEDEGDVEYTVVMFKGVPASPGLKRQEDAVEDPSAVYSSVTKKPRV